MTASQLITYPNPSIRFLTGLSFPADGLERADFHVTGSHGRIPTDWQQIPFRLASSDGRLAIEFARPENFSYFRIELVGYGGSLANATAHFMPSLSPEQARSVVKTRSIAFLACARSCAGQLEASLQKLQSLGRLFGSSRIIVFENDSNDGTRELLRRWTEQGSVQLISQDGLDQSLPLRTQRLGYARNRLLDEVRPSAPDYFCVADLDGVMGESLTEESFLSNFEQKDCWDACFPVAQSFYYDLWALRHPELCPFDYHRVMNRLSQAFTPEDSVALIVDPLQSFRFDRMQGWLAVDSAFGGMGLYRTEAFSDCRYFGIKDGQETCEHVVFHQQARRDGARLYINPKFVVDGLPSLLKFRRN
jgi:hypothetical protein